MKNFSLLTFTPFVSWSGEQLRKPRFRLVANKINKNLNLDTMAIYGLSKIDLLENLSIRATEDEIAQLFEIPKRLVRDYHFEWLFKKKFKTYDEVLEFVKEFEPNYAHDTSFKESMSYYDEKIANHDFLKTTKLEWACSTLARMRRLCGGGYKICCYLKHNF